jgi:hypothetical protein
VPSLSLIACLGSRVPIHCGRCTTKFISAFGVKVEIN